MPAFNDFFCGTSHIDVYAGNSISFYYFCCFTKFFRIFSKYLYYERIFIFFMTEGFFLEIFRVNKSISTIKFRENYRFRCNFFDDLSVWTICIPIHRSQCWYGSLDCEFFPKVFIHKIFMMILAIYIEKWRKIQLFWYGKNFLLICQFFSSKGILFIRISGPFMLVL